MYVPEIDENYVFDIYYRKDGEDLFEKEPEPRPYNEDKPCDTE